MIDDVYAAADAGHTRVRILFASIGGTTDNALYLYAMLRTAPVELTMVAMGNVEQSRKGRSPWTRRRRARRHR